jgi:hypothetical protein
VELLPARGMQIALYSMSAHQASAAYAVLNAADAAEGDKYEFHADGRGRDPSTAAPCADSNSRQRHGRRHRARHTRARAALCASISGDNVRSWLRTILISLNRNRLRSLARRPSFSSIDETDASNFTGPEAGGRNIKRAIGALTKDQRDALLLVVLEGLSYRAYLPIQQD